MPELFFHDPRATLDAGGIATMAHEAGDLRTGPVRAHAYTHEAVSGRTVVRLEVDAVARGADAEMDVLGFAPTTTSDVLGIAHVRAAGFPAWALIHMPELARFALEVTRDFKKASKRAMTKPGHAKEDFETIAARLGRSVPAFLPSFWEEVGRAYLRADALQYATQSFERARRAEKEFALPVDEAARDAAFLEFSLAGAVAVKSLVAYGKELAASNGAEVAYTRFRELAVRRCLGGLPPWASMVKDLRTLAKAAKRDLDAEEDDLARQLLGSPSLSRAPSDFFTSLAPAFVRVTASEPSLLPKLAAIFPGGTGYDYARHAELRTSYLLLLERAGVIAYFVAVPDDALAKDAIGAFVSRLIAYGGGSSKEETIGQNEGREIVERALVALAPRLIARGESIEVAVRSGYAQTLSLELAERALELGVEVTVKGWNHGFAINVPLTVDPVRVAAHPVLGPVLVTTVAKEFGTRFESLTAGRAGFIAARRLWLTSHSASIGSGALVDAMGALFELESKTRAATFEEFAVERDALAAVDFATVLAEALRLGFIDELAWPEYERAVAELGGKVELDGMFPYLVVRSSLRAICVGPAGRMVEHDFVYDPKAEQIRSVYYVDGVLLVQLGHRTTYEMVAYYSHAPKSRFKASYYSYGRTGRSVVLPSGAMTFGGRALRRGDHDVSFPANGQLSCDGRDLFMHAFAGKEWAMSHVDPETGKPLRRGRPTFIEAGTAEGKLLEQHSFVLPVPGAPGHLLTPVDDLIGLRVVQTEAGKVATSLDGLRFVSRTVTPMLLFRFPGDDSLAVATDSNAMGARGQGAVVCDARGRRRALPTPAGIGAVGWDPAPLPPPLALAFCSARDPEGSKALRSVTDALAKSLLDAAAADFDAEDREKAVDKAALARTMRAVEAKLPSLTDASLRRVVTLATAHAHLFGRRRDALLARVDEVAAVEAVETSALANVAEGVAALFAKTGEVEVKNLDFLDLIFTPRRAVFVALSPTTTASDRRALADVAEALLATGLVERAGDLRVVTYETNYERRIATGYPSKGGLMVVSKGTSRIAVTQPYGASLAYELSNGPERFDFTPFAPKSERRPPDIDIRGVLEAFVALVRRAPDASWPVPLVTELAERARITRAEASLLLSGAPTTRSYGKDLVGPKLRKTFDLKVVELDAARMRLGAFEATSLRTAVEIGLPLDPEVMLTMPSADEGAQQAIDTLAAAVGAHVGMATVISSEFASAIDQSISGTLTGVQLAQVWMDPASLVAIASKPRPVAVGFHHRDIVASYLAAAPQLLAFAQVSLRRDDPLRAHASAFLSTLRQVVARPETEILVASGYADPKDTEAAARRHASLLGAELKPGEQPGELTIDGGTIRVHVRHGMTNVFVRGASWARLDRTVLQTIIGDAALAGQTGGAELFALDYLEGAYAERLARAIVVHGDDGYDADPRRSAPECVGRIASRYGLTEDGATLYLETLTHRAPTAKLVLAWNGWSKATYDAASAELVDKALVVVAERERAGRRIFLPGEWCKGTNEDLPFEGWKKQQPVVAQLGRAPRALAYAPMSECFAYACARIEAGDVPRFEEVRR